MAVTHHLKIYPNLPLVVGKEFYRPPSLAAILKLDPGPALKEKFRIREFTLGIRQEDSEQRCPIDTDGSLFSSAAPLGDGTRESLSQDLQAQKVTETGPIDDGNQGNAAVQETDHSSRACTNHERAEDGKAGARSGGALDLLVQASAGAETDQGCGASGSQETSCPVCDSFSTDSAIVLSAHIVECLSVTKNQKVKGKKKMRSILDVIAADLKFDSPAPTPRPSAAPVFTPVSAPARLAPPETGDDTVKETESLKHAEREIPEESTFQGTKRSFRNRVARKSADFIMEPLMKKRRRKRILYPYRGIKQRSSGRWVAEISDASKKARLWLGTFDTAEDAAMAYDRAAIKIHGAGAATNILSPAEAAVAGAKEGMSVRRGRRRKQKPEKLPLKLGAQASRRADSGGQREAFFDASTEEITPPTADHSMNSVTHHDDQNRNSNITATPEIPASDRNEKIASLATPAIADLNEKVEIAVPLKGIRPCQVPDNVVVASGRLEMPVPLKTVYPCQIGSDDDDIVVASGRLRRGRPPRSKRGGWSMLVPNRKVVSCHRGGRKRKKEDDWDSPEPKQAKNEAVGSTALEILD